MSESSNGSGLRKLNSEFVTRYISESGTQEINRDYFAYVPMDGYICWAVAETYDQDTDPFSARIAVETVLTLFQKRPTLSFRRLKSYIREANRQLVLQSAKYERKASIMVVVSNYKKLRYAQSGNCRLYIFRNGNIFLRSDDQTLQNKLAKEGYIPDDEFHGIEESRNLLSYIGQNGRPFVYVSKKIDLLDEDVLLLSTWGMWEKLTALEMLDALSGEQTADSYLDELQELLLSKQEAGYVKHGRKKQIVSRVNSYTAAAVFVNKTYVFADNRRKYIKIALIAGIPLIIIVLAFGIVIWVRNNQRKENIAAVRQFQQQGDMYFVDQNYERAFIAYENGLEESKKLKETNGKKGTENLEIKDLITARHRTVQLLLDGSELFQGEKYEEASKNYANALKEAKYDMAFYELLDSDYITEFMDLCNDYVYVNELLLTAERQTSLFQYKEALVSLNEAGDTALDIGFRDAVNDIKLRISEIEGQIQTDADNAAQEEAAEIQQAKDERLKAIEMDVLSGDTAAGAGNVTEAFLLYKKAIDAYVSEGEVAKASDVQFKITSLEAEQKGIALEEALSAVEEAVMSGDTAAADGNYELAAQIYQQAALDYLTAGDSAKASEVQYKIIELNDTQKTEAQEQRVLEIELLVMDGDTAAEAEDFNKAKQLYEQAVNDYLALGDITKATEIRLKITDAETKEKESARTKLLAEIEANLLEGELAEASGDYGTAIDIYIQGEEDYVAAGESVKAAELRFKIVDLEGKEEEEAGQTVLSEIEAITKQGDLAAAEGDMARAIKLYEQAAQAYKDAEEESKAVETQLKTTEMKEEDEQQQEEDAAEKAKEEEDEQKEKDEAEISIAENYVQRGDSYAARNDYDNAIDRYEEALEIYLKLDMSDKVKETNEKIDKASDKKIEQDLNIKIGEAQSVEEEGDQYLLLGNYVEAKERYRRAQILYQGLAQTDKVLLIQEKINEIIAIEDEADKEAEEAVRSQLIHEGELLELDGDNKVKNGSYEEALELYGKAKEKYQQALAYDKVLVLQEKIYDAERSLP